MNRQITKKKLKKELIQDPLLSLVQFKTDWSGACQIIAPLYKELGDFYKGTANFYEIDVEREKGVDTDFGIMEYPTILFFRRGQVIDHVVGIISKNMLITKIENALATSI